MKLKVFANPNKIADLRKKIILEDKINDQSALHKYNLVTGKFKTNYPFKTEKHGVVTFADITYENPSMLYLSMVFKE